MFSGVQGLDIPGFLSVNFGVEKYVTSMYHQYFPLLFFCRYKDFRDNNGKYTLFYWELLAIRLGFIIAFEVGGTFGIMLPLLFWSCYVNLLV